MDTHSRRANGERASYPARVLTLSLLLTALTLGWLGYCAFSSFSDVARNDQRYIRSTQLRGIIVHLDEVLTMSASMAATTGNAKWEVRYRAHEGQLDDAIKAAMRDEPPSVKQTRQLDAANIALVKMENSAFDQVRNGHTDRARAILFSPFYAQQKAIYADAIGNYMKEASARQERAMSAQKRRAASAIWVGISGLISLSVGWIVALRALGNWGDSQRREVAARARALQELEAKRAQLEASEQRYASMAANVPGMVYQLVQKADGTIEMPFVSEGARELHGLEPAAICADPRLIMDAISQRDREVLNALAAISARDLTPLHWEGRIRHADGTLKWVRDGAQPQLLPGGDIIWDCLTTDITASKRYEAQLEAARAEAERANAAKSEFLSRMSHELRTPLNAVLGFGQLLEVDDPRPQQAESIEQILLAGRHLLDLINEVLDIARIESGQENLRLQSLDAGLCAREVGDLVRPLARENAVVFELCLEAGCCGAVSCNTAHVLADAQRLKQILLNLYSNAIKYAGRGARVTVSCGKSGCGDDARATVTVRDDGPGIAPALQERIWTPFDRIGAESGATQGSGIGLPLARSLARAMGGDLTLWSLPGEGCAFTLELPCAPSHDLTELNSLMSKAQRC